MNVNSVTKGIMALLVGIALDKGFIKNVDQKVIDFFPDYIVKRGEKTIYDVTIRNMLTMTAVIHEAAQQPLTYFLPLQLQESMEVRVMENHLHCFFIQNGAGVTRAKLRNRRRGVSLLFRV